MIVIRIHGGGGGGDSNCTCVGKSRVFRWMIIVVVVVAVVVVAAVIVSMIGNLLSHHFRVAFFVPMIYFCFLFVMIVIITVLKRIIVHRNGRRLGRTPTTTHEFEVGRSVRFCCLINWK